jgi:hypothetical protein
MTATQHKIECYWWATSKPSQLNTECGNHSNRIVNWPRSGTACQWCGKVMAYAANAADAAKLRADGHDTTWRHTV